MSHHPRRILTPGASRKRKEREALYSFKPLASAQAAANMKMVHSKAVSSEPVCSNGILAGYMAYEFLTKGTLLGEKFDPGRAEAVALVGTQVESKRTKPEVQETSVMKKEHKSYAEVASILKTEGAHIPGIVNPTQLARWIQM